MSDLQKPLTLTTGTALMLNIVIGAGLLALPGLAVKQAGNLALYSWLICGLVSFPLLSIFIILGRRYPDAGGIAHFAKQAFGNYGYASASLVLLGAVLFGLPSIALTGGYYAAVVTGLSPHLLAISILSIATVILLFSSSAAAKINTALSIIIITTIVAVLAAGLLLIPSPSDQQLAAPTLSDVPIIFTPFMIIFFAFTGWEVAAGLSEEFKNPKRDFPLAMLMSFAITVLLYIAIAFLAYRVPLEGHYETAFARIADIALGTSVENLVALLATIIIVANLSGAVWAISRMVFSLSREGFLSSSLQTSKTGSPWLAVLTTSGTLILIIVLDWLGYLGLERMLALAGQNFIVLYGIGAASLMAVTLKASERLLAVVVVAIVVGLVVVQGTIAIYPAALITTAVIGVAIRRWILRHHVAHLSKLPPGEAS